MKSNLKKSPKLVDINDIVPSGNPLVSVMKVPAERLLGLRRINMGYANAHQRWGSAELANDFFGHMCDEFGMNFEVDGDSLDGIPAEGPVVVLSNHPYGLADGLLLGKFLTSIRKDVKIVANNPQYRYLFGVVSTSAKYESFSFKFIADFLKHHAMDDELASMIKAKNPPKGRALKPSEVESIVRQQLSEQDLSDLVSQIESDRKGIPVLLRQYLKLNGKILGFNIDEDFGGVLDCMILVDLHRSPRRSLEKYMGKDAVARMLGEQPLS